MRIKVKDLIKKLQEFNQDADIVCQWDGGYSNPNDIDIDENGIIVINVEEWGSYDY